MCKIHRISLGDRISPDVGNRSIMAALDEGSVGCARTTRPHWYAYALVNDAQTMQVVFTHPCLLLFVFLSVFLFRLLFSFYLTFSSSFSFLQLNTVNYGLHLGIIQTLCLHFSRSTSLRKTLTVNHYLRIEIFSMPGATGTTTSRMTLNHHHTTTQ